MKEVCKKNEKKPKKVLNPFIIRVGFIKQLTMSKKKIKNKSKEEKRKSY